MTGRKTRCAGRFERASLLLLFCLAGNCLGIRAAENSLIGGTEETEKAKDMKQNIVDLIKRYEAALNASDTKAVMSCYGRDPVFMPQNSAALEGRAAVQAGYDRVFGAIKLKVTFDAREIVVLDEMAYGRTTSAGLTRILASGETVKEDNNELFIFRKEDGGWKIHRYLFATSNPPAER